MKRKVNIVSCFLLLVSCFCSPSICQTTETTIDNGKKYDEIIDLNSLEVIKATHHDEEPKKEKQKDELELFLPKLDSELFKSWLTTGEAEIWTNEGDKKDFVLLPKDLLNELKAEKILKQSYKNENLFVDIFIYKFKDFTGAYSAYTILHKGAIAKLKVGKNASESDNSITFWKGNYYIDINTQNESTRTAKEFLVLASQEISNNIKQEVLPPVVTIQLPALNRVQGSEKYCLGTVCLTAYIPKILSEFDPALFKLEESGGIVGAEYELEEGKNDKEKILLSIVRYLTKETAGAVLNSLKGELEKKKNENKEIDIDTDLEDGTVKVKNKKNDFTFLKQKGNLLAIAQSVKDKKSGEKILNLVPWPIEIAK